MSNNSPNIWTAPALVLVGCGFLLFAGALAADSNRCAVCGDWLRDRVYLVRDAVTRERKQVCERCVQLTTTCYVCGLPTKENFTQLPDGRVACARDAKTVVLADAEGQQICAEVKAALDRLFSRFLTFPDTNVTVAFMDRVNLLQLFKVPGKDYQCPNAWGYVHTATNGDHFHHTITLLTGLPRGTLKATCAHEHVHTWLNENIPADRRQRLSRDAVEGFCELVAFLLMDSLGEDAEKHVIQANLYTRGQIDLFLAAEKRYGFNEVVEWMKYGVDSRLDGNDLGRVRKVDLPARANGAPTTHRPTYQATPARAARVPEMLVLQGISWSPTRPMALINDRTFGIRDEASVRVGSTNLTIRCLAIRKDAVLIEHVESGEKQELQLRAR
jgi:hypothetical protein